MIYLDYHATTPCDPQVIEAMLPYFGEIFGNPASSIHKTGKIAASAVEESRALVAALIGAHPKEIIFTSGATESNNIAIQGLATDPKRKRDRIVTTAIEHKSILAPYKKLEKAGFDVIFLPVDHEGVVDLSVAKNSITENTLLVSIQAASNEIGTIQPIEELTDMAHKMGAYVHCDAAQAVGKIPIEIAIWDIDLLSISAHKLYGPKGVGALYIRGGPYALPIQPLVLGGGQESNIRSGTLNVPGIVGFGKACKLCSEYLPEEAECIGKLRDRFEEKISAAVQNIKRNGALGKRLPNNSSLTFPGIDAEALIANLPDLAISTGSACTSGALEPSYILQAIGLNRRDAYSTLRIGIGRFTTEEEIQYAVETIGNSCSYMKEAFN
jgi:cysteine desulfurase